MASTTVYKKISGRNTIAGVHNQGTFTVNNYDGPREPPLCRLFPFPRNLEFVERPDVTRELERLLPPSSGYHSAALWGLGGSGKTQIALQYAHNRCADPKCSTFWVHADSETSFS
ncbi:P-loop containing nucleoside triphosphate hydrolase protein [Apiospora arundinis]|uniref:P-loop containing nucleoside triphosphate hydrolase protein n=1 Tax=Apiospora arundinis TaxID=335852 RepID=A0ABR2HRV7_9PEZI